jgi:hypothetical protein
MIALPRSFPVIIVVGAFMLWPKICSASEKEAVVLLPRIYPSGDALEPAKDNVMEADDCVVTLEALQELARPFDVSISRE